MKWILLFIFAACTTPAPKSEPKPSLDMSFQTAGVEQYFLPEPPAWMNFSQNGECYFNNRRIYLDFSRLHSTYQLTLAELIEFQVQINEKFNQSRKHISAERVTPREEAHLFYEVLERVRGGVKRLKLPTAMSTRIIWKESKIPQKILGSDILASLCMSTSELEAWLEKTYPEGEHPYVLGGEALSVYQANFLMQPFHRFLWEGLFDPSVKLTTPHLYLPAEFGSSIIYQR
jgi:hypothetical protein